MGTLPLATPLKRTFPLSPTTINFLQVRRVGLRDLPPLLHDGMLTCPLLNLFFVCNHSYWWFENITFAFKQPRHRGFSRVKTLFPLVFAYRGGAFLLSLYSPSLGLQEATGLPPFLPPLCLQSSVLETLTAHMGKQYFFFSAGKLEWVAPWKQSHKMTSLLPHLPGHPLSPWICGQTLLTSGLLTFLSQAKETQLWKKRCGFISVFYEQGGRALGRRYVLPHLTGCKGASWQAGHVAPLVACTTMNKFNLPG